MKIDVEGSEVEVIKGGLKTINSKRPFMITEVLNSMTKKEIDINKSIVVYNFYVSFATSNTHLQ